jgi:cleavage and polyadenylation specificity factor subunit 4
MMSKIGGVIGGGGWKYAHGTAHYGRNFNLRWLKVRLNPFACYSAADSL